MTAMTLPAKPWTNGQLTADKRYYFDSTVGVEGAWRANPIPVGNVPAGSIIQWASNTIPANWLLCDGSAVSRTVYPSLFATIGTQYGAGDGSTTFNLPDLRGRVAVGKNGGTFGTLGATGGAETHALTTDQMPSHGHDIFANSFAGDLKIVMGPRGGDGAFYSVSDSGNDAGVASAVLYAKANGGGGAHNNLQPYQVTNYIIKATIGVTAGDSQLAVRTATLETNPVISGNMTIAGNVSGSGRHTAALQPSFMARNTAYLAAAQTIVCDQVLHNVGSHYNSSNGRFTAPAAGTYTFSFSTLVYNMGSATAVFFYKNGTEYCHAGVYGQFSGNYAGQGGTVTMYLNANDYVYPVMNYGGTALHANYTLFSGHLVA